MSYSSQNPSSIQSLFNSIAKRYDLGNALLSFQMHRLWNRSLIKRGIKIHFPQTCLDLCCGTGDILFTYLKKQTIPLNGYMLDFSSEMLSQAKKKALHWNLERHNIHYFEADAQKIPLPDHSVDVITLAYGIRNIQHPFLCIQEAFRVLRPGGHFTILELTRPSNRFLRWGHSLYLKYILPKMAFCLASNPKAYRYLCDSIHAFMSPETIKKMFEQAGFIAVGHQALTGGVATLIFGKKN